MDINDKLNKILFEAQEEIIDPDEEVSAYDKDELLDAPPVDWTGIPNAKPGKTLNDLKKVKLPLQHGWTFDEVLSALKPSIISVVKRYQTPLFSAEDGISAAMEGVVEAVENDKGISPFTSHVWNYLKSYVARAAAKQSVVSGVKPFAGGKTDILAGVRKSVSADVADDSGKTFASQIIARDDRDDRAVAIKKLFHKLITNERTGLNDNEKIVLMASIGVNRDGNPIDPKTNVEIADALGVSNVRITQIRNGAMSKVKDQLDRMGLRNPEDALDTVEESVIRALINVYENIIRLEISMLQEQVVNVLFDMNGVMSEAIVTVDTEDMSIRSAVCNESDVMKYLTSKNIMEATNQAKRLASPKLFAEMTNQIISMQAPSILGIIGHDIKEDENDKMQSRKIYDEINDAYDYESLDVKLVEISSNTEHEYSGPGYIGGSYTDHTNDIVISYEITDQNTISRHMENGNLEKYFEDYTQDDLDPFISFGDFKRDHAVLNIPGKWFEDSEISLKNVEIVGDRIIVTYRVTYIEHHEMSDKERRIRYKDSISY